MEDRKQRIPSAALPATAGRALLYLWSAQQLRGSVEDWKEITPEPIQKAVEALRRRFQENTWKVSEVMRQGCYPALHRGMAKQALAIVKAIKELGAPSLPTVDEGNAEPAVFAAHFYLCAALLGKDIADTFAELLEIGSAKSALLSGDPVDWAEVETKVLVADESYLIPLWTKNACDKQPPASPMDDPNEILYWENWRAPVWLYMQPFGNRRYDRATAWDRMDEPQSAHMLRVAENRFNQRLMNTLTDAVDKARIRLAKQAPSTMGLAVGAKQELTQAADKTDPADPATQQNARRAAVDAYIAEVLKQTGKKITRKDFWKAAGYTDRTEFERWQRCDARTNASSNHNFCRVLETKPHLPRPK